MDLTGSMDSYINKMKCELAKLLSQLSEQNQDIQLRFAFVGYKDFCDGKSIDPMQDYETMIQHFSIIDFTNQMDQVNSFLQKQEAYGGGDTPEDLVGGLYQAFKLNWEMDSHKIVILVADAPTHGDQYHHEYMGDNFPNGHPNPKLTLEAMMEKFANIQASFLIFRLNYDTEIMFEIMKNQYKARQQKIRFVDLRKILQKAEFEVDFMDKAKASNSLESLNSLEKHDKKANYYDYQSDEERSFCAQSIVNMKIAEKIMVESQMGFTDNESWEQN